MQIVSWDDGKPVVSRGGKSYFENRLTPDLDQTNNRFTLVVTKANYNDSGNYSVNPFVKVAMIEGLREESATVTVNVHGMFLSYI